MNGLHKPRQIQIENPFLFDVSLATILFRMQKCNTDPAPHNDFDISIDIYIYNFFSDGVQFFACNCPYDTVVSTVSLNWIRLSYF